VATPFSQTLRSLAGHRGAGRWFALAVGGLFLAGWAGWFWTSEVPLYAESGEARLEVAAAPHPVASAVEARLVAVHARVGDEVAAGEVLFELDSEPERARYFEEEARGRALAAEIEGLARVEEQMRRTLAAAREAAGAAAGEARSQGVAATAAATLAEEEAARGERLHGEGLIAEQELKRLRSEAAERRAMAAAGEQALARARGEGGREVEVVRSDLEEVARQRLRLEGEVRVSAVALRRLTAEIERRQVRSPLAGRIAEAARVEVGAVVGIGAWLATVLPPAELRVVASFPPAQALARIRPGQRASLRLEGFPWTEFGELPARVERVAAEPRGGGVRVDCALEPAASGERIPRVHGLPGTLLVEVERVTPAILVMRAAGKGGARTGSGVSAAGG
jgi:membrane fusion protein (multidrug efflux system)